MNKQVLAWIVCILVMASIGYTVLEKVAASEVVRFVISLVLTVSACVMITLIVGNDNQDEQEDTQKTTKNKG